MKIILFCHRRSGSTVVTNAFKKNWLPEFGNYDPEFLNAYCFPESKLIHCESLLNYYGLQIHDLIQTHDNDARHILIRKVLFKLFRGDENIIIKIFPETENHIISIDELISIKQKFNLMFVSLIREDLLSFSISYTAAVKTKVWNTTSTSELLTYDNIICSKDDIQKINLEHVLTENMQWQNKLSNYNNYMDKALSYEKDIITHKYFDKLGFPIPDNNILRVMDSYKQNKFLLQNTWILDTVSEVISRNPI